MKLALIVTAAALCFASSLHASATKNVALKQPPQIVPPLTVVGGGSGEFTLPGLGEGNIVAHLYDQQGTRRYQLKGSVVFMIPATNGREGMQGAFHGALLAPGTNLQVEGTWTVSADGHGVLGAVVLGPGEEGGAGAKIGKIVGSFTLPTAESLCHADLIAASAIKMQRSELPRRPKLIVDPLPGDFIDPHLTGLSVPLDLRWKLAE